MITTGATAIGIAVWSARQNATLAREQRTQQRLADSYLEVLRLIEREGLWVDAGITDWKLAAEDPYEEQRRVKVPEPAVTDRATIAAHLAAFDSDHVRGLYQEWRVVIAAIDTEV
ncbi:MAG: hypothetical protein ACRDSH_01405, partial [Pseudonocardiaceae bacterium]